MTRPLDPVALLTDLVATPSVSRSEGPAADLLDTWLRDHGLQTERLDDLNVVVRLRGAAPGPTLLLNSHLDTVPAKDGWDTDPWTPTLRDGRLIGLGSGDAKASVAAMACAVVELARQGLPAGQLIFAASVMEEVGGGGLEFIKDRLGPLDAALVGEPTSLQGAIAQGGLLIIEGCAHGRTAHAARAHEGVNALPIAARDILTITDLPLERQHPFLGTSTANVTVARAGDRHNVIPDRAEFTVDVRYTSAYAPEELFDLLDQATRSELRVRSKRLMPVETSPDAAIVQALLAVAPGTGLFGSPTMSDWVHLRGVPTVKIGPGDSERSHTPNESVALSDVTRAHALYRDVARRFLAPGAAP